MKLVIIALLFSTAATFAADAPKLDPSKQVAVTLPVQVWQAVINSVADSTKISARDAALINQEIVSQVRGQTAPKPPEKK